MCQIGVEMDALEQVKGVQRPAPHGGETVCFMSGNVACSAHQLSSIACSILHLHWHLLACYRYGINRFITATRVRVPELNSLGA
jgi:hypothetical protein